MIKHPAKFTDTILNAISKYIQPEWKVLDPFAGTGKLKLIKPDAYLNELEFEWSIQGKPANAICGNALYLPYKNETFDSIIVSPTYSNRMADHHIAKDNSKRLTYTHQLGRQLHNDNSGKMQWGKEYKDFHEKAWLESDRVLKCGGMFILNISNHIRKGVEIDVSSWHKEYLTNVLGYAIVNVEKIETPRLKMGSNYNIRVSFEYLFVLKKG